MSKIDILKHEYVIISAANETNNHHLKYFSNDFN